MKASVLYKCECKLGEGPMWYAKRNSCFWVDIDGKGFYEYSWKTAEVKRWQVEQHISLIVEAKNDELILGMENGLASFNLETNVLKSLVDIERNISTNRSNDGACDVTGRLWIGTMAKDFTSRKGSLYCIEKDLSITKKLNNLTISNGLTWSLDNKRMYFIDSSTQFVQCFLFDTEKAEIKFERVAIEIDKKLGTPDGMTTDEEGMLWIAHYNGFAVCRWDPSTGKLLEKVELPVPQVTCCTFGDENFDHLIITTAREKMNKEDLKKYPDSGNLFVAKVNVKGVPKFQFGNNS
jgi:sugar lactone lactonase YvrE